MGRHRRAGRQGAGRRCDGHRGRGPRKRRLRRLGHGAGTRRPCGRAGDGGPPLGRRRTVVHPGRGLRVERIAVDRAARPRPRAPGPHGASSPSVRPGVDLPTPSADPRPPAKHPSPDLCRGAGASPARGHRAAALAAVDHPRGRRRRGGVADRRLVSPPLADRTAVPADEDPGPAHRGQPDRDGGPPDQAHGDRRQGGLRHPAADPGTGRLRQRTRRHGVP